MYKECVDDMLAVNTVAVLTRNSPEGVNLHKCVSGGSTLQTCKSEKHALESTDGVFRSAMGYTREVGGRHA